MLYAVVGIIGMLVAPVSWTCHDDLCMAYGKLRVFLTVQARLGMCLLRLVFPQILILHDITLRKSNMAMENPPYIDMVFP